MDFIFRNHGSVTILTPISDDAKAWIAEHVGEERTEWGGGIVIEPRYVDPILDHIVADGMTVNA